MAKKVTKTASNTKNNQLPDKKLKGQRVAITGKMQTLTKGELALWVKEEGGTLVEQVDSKLNYLVLGQSRGVSAGEKKAIQLNQKGASIQTLLEQDFYDFLNHTRDELLALINGGTAANKVLQAWSRRQYYFSHRIDLSGVNLQGVVLEKVSLHGINFDGADFSQAKLTNVDFGELNQVNFNESQLKMVHFEEIKNCTFQKASLQELDFAEAEACDFRQAKFSKSISDFSDFRKSDFSYAEFIEVESGEAQFTQANLTGVKLAKANLEDCNFQGATLVKADLSHAELRNANLKNADLSQANLSGATLVNANLTGAKLDGTNLAGTNLLGIKLATNALQKAVNADQAVTATQNPAGANVKKLAGQLKGSASFETTAKLRNSQGELTIKLWGNKNWSSASTSFRPKKGQMKHGYISHNSFTTTLQDVAHQWADMQLDVSSITVKGSKLTLKGTALQAVVAGALCEMWGETAPTEDDLKEQAKAARQANKKKQDAVKADLNDSANGFVKWNKRSAPVRQTAIGKGEDFSKKNLDGINLSNLKMLQAKCVGTSLVGANFEKSDLTGSDFSQAVLKNALLSFANLVQVNLSTADLTGAKLEKIGYDEKTLFPSNFQLPASAIWRGHGMPPDKRKEFALTAPIDFNAFMDRLKETTDSGRLAKSLKMLKADRFQLFSQVDADSVMGVVKSQTDRDLVYSCRLTSEGKFACCTQNLNACGGLSGRLCKHLLVLIIGLTKGNQLDATSVATWVEASRYHKPVLEKELMSDVLIRYKGAEAGEIDWRPTETVPEDYYMM